jgi:hypothetical protein
MLDGRIVGIGKDVIRATIREYVKGNIPLQGLIDEFEDYCLTMGESFMLSALLPHHNSKKEEAEEEVFVDDLMDEIAKLRPCKRKECCDYAEENEEMCARHLKQQEKKRCSTKGCNNIAKTGGVCQRVACMKRAKINIKLCSTKGCNNIAHMGGVCNRVACLKRAKINIKLCSTKGCTSRAQKGGVCRRKACMKRAGISRKPSSRKPCSTEGCPGAVHRGGVCQRKACMERANVNPLPCMKRKKTFKACTGEGCKYTCREDQEFCTHCTLKKQS